VFTKNRPDQGELMKNVLLMTVLFSVNTIAMGFQGEPILNAETTYSENILLEGPSAILNGSSESDYYYCIDLKVEGSSQIYGTFCDEDPGVASHECNAEAISHSTSSADFHCDNLRRIYP
jgi:hypothetical protein